MANVFVCFYRRILRDGSMMSLFLHVLSYSDDEKTQF